VGTRLYVRQVIETVRASSGSVSDAAEYLDLRPAQVRRVKSRSAGSVNERFLLEAVARRAPQPRDSRAAPRAGGHDVAAVTEGAALEGLDDEPLLSLARDQGRALLTSNVGDLALPIRDWTGRGESHAGVIYTSDESTPRSRNAIGLFVERLSALLGNRRGEESFRDRVEWLGRGN
jgi:hypothetical protein